MPTWVRFDDAGKKWEYSTNAGGAWNDLIENPTVEKLLFNAIAAPGIDHQFYRDSTSDNIVLELPTGEFLEIVDGGIIVDEISQLTGQVQLAADLRLADASTPTGAAGRGHLWHDSGDSILKYKNDDNVALPLTKRPSCSVYPNATLVFANGVWAPLQFQVEWSDTDNFHDISTNNTRITIPTGLGGYYLFFSSISYTETTTTGWRIVRLIKNGSADWGQDRFQPIVAGSGTAVHRTVWQNIIEAVDGNYFEFKFYQSSGGNITVLSGIQTVFGCVRVGDF